VKPEKIAGPYLISRAVRHNCCLIPWRWTTVDGGANQLWTQTKKKHGGVRVW